MSKIPVQALYDNCEMMLNERWGYIYGTAGVRCTQAVIDKSIERFPKNAEMTRRYGPQWLGRMVTDCSGLIVYIYKQFGLKIPHGSSSMVRQGYIVDCGPTPHPGWAALVDPTPNTPDNDHIGIVQEDGVTVVEAKGTRYGVVKSKVTDSKWNKFGRFKDVDYSGEVSPLPDGEKMSRRAEVITKKDPLNMRTGPGVRYDIIGKIPKGTIVDVWTKCENNWYFVDDDGDQGYVDGQYLAFLPPVSPKPEEDDKEPTSDDEEPQIVNYGVLIPCDTKEDADALAAFFVNAQVISGDD